MTQLNQIYKCPICGNIVEVLHTGVGELVCCGQPMELVSPKDKDEGMEKHLPVTEITEEGIVVKVGSIPHPMEDAHYIEWIELITDNKIYRHFLKPGEEPKTLFKIKIKSFSVRAYCNVHGLWQLN